MSTTNASKPLWSSGDVYEPYVGRWSRLVAPEFVRWLALPDGKQWLDVGCGTGALSQAILDLINPAKIKGVDKSEGFIDYARHRLRNPKVEFEVGDAQSLPVDSESFDAAVSGLVLNFVPRPDQMIAEMKRAVHAGGTIAIYIWDYAGKMQMMRHFWNAAAALDPAARDLDEGRRFPLCSPNSLEDLFQNAGLSQVQVRAIDISTDFKDFDDFWSPFLRGQAPAPSYAMSLSEEKLSQLRERLYNSLPFALDGSIPLVARVWAVKGMK